MFQYSYCNSAQLAFFGNSGLYKLVQSAAGVANSVQECTNLYTLDEGVQICIITVPWYNLELYKFVQFGGIQICTVSQGL